MGKFIYALMAVICIELAIWLFAGAEYAETSLFNLIKEPTSSKVFYQLIISAISGITATVIIASVFSQFNIYGVFAGVAASLATFGLSIFHFVQFVYGETSSILSQELAILLSVVLTAPLAITYLISTLEWIRSN